MFSRVFLHTVSALCYSLIELQEGARSPACTFGNNEAVNFVVAQWKRAPDYLRGPIFLATLLLCAFPLLTCGKPFYRLDRPQRLRQLQLWKNLPLLRGRELLQFYESLVLLGWQNSILQQRSMPKPRAVPCP